VWQNTFGGQPMTVSYVIQHASWEDFGTEDERRLGVAAVLGQRPPQPDR
jgi:hypothetical protein